MTVLDDLGRHVPIEPPPRRIVSLVPSITELLFWLGLGERVVGVTRYCTEPANRVARIEKFGGTKNPDLGAIAKVAPDLVLANAEENRIEDFAALEGGGLRVYVTFPRSVVGFANGLERLGVLLQASIPCRKLQRQIHWSLRQVSAGPPPVRAFVPIWKNPWMSFNHDTFASDVLQSAGAINVCSGFESRYPNCDLERVANADPEVILLPSEPYRFQRKDLLDLAPLRGTTAVRSGRVYFVDGKALSWFGPRTPAALRYFANLLRREPSQ
ncbi:MAG: ABC transporter substrate-binding protein [Candidatus Binatia bacterium]|nr:MAG: ABC transporter substrate-binding protein [Candidatus Binatia bacterium]